MDYNTIEINDRQKEIYDDYDRLCSKQIALCFCDIIDFSKMKKEISVLDVGGAGGYFAKELHNLLTDKGFAVSTYVVDTMDYPGWSENNGIIYIKNSVENIDDIFGENKFDLIFCNRVVHHLVTGGSYRSTIAMIENCFKKMSEQLKDEGQLCILDHFYNGIIVDWLASHIIYTLTSIKNPVLSKIFERFGAKSAGIGVCFQSEKMWKSLIAESKLKITVLNRGKSAGIGKIKKLVLHIKNICEDSYIICKKA